MESTLKTYKLDSGEIQRVQMVVCDDWDSLFFFEPSISKDALKHIAKLYEDFFIKAAPYFFGEMIIFHIPDDIELPFSVDGIEDRHIAAKMYLSKNRNSKIAKEFMAKLEDIGYLYRVSGKNPFTHNFMPYPSIGFMTETENAKLKVNASFFSFDVLDSDSPYDCFGIPVGLRVKDGKVIAPPLYHREALLAKKNGETEIRIVNLDELKLSISGKIFERPDFRRTPSFSGYDIVVVGDRVVAVNRGGKTLIPETGFIIQTKEEGHLAGEIISYSGLDDVAFGIQCGNSIVIDGKPTETFVSHFYHWLKKGEIKTTPGRYPHDFENDRAPRIVLGSNKDGKPVILWAEGASKAKYELGVDSCGASLKEMGDIALDLGLVNAVNLDGGGSAQILIDGKRSLKISDRDFSNNLESERAVPIGIMVK